MLCILKVVITKFSKLFWNTTHFFLVLNGPFWSPSINILALALVKIFVHLNYYAQDYFENMKKGKLKAVQIIVITWEKYLVFLFIDSFYRFYQYDALSKQLVIHIVLEMDSPWFLENWKTASKWSPFFWSFLLPSYNNLQKYALFLYNTQSCMPCLSKIIISLCYNIIY